MKVCLVSYDEYRNIPYIQKYERMLSEHGVAYDIILWNRSGETAQAPRNHFVFESRVQKSRRSKLIPFLKWRHFALRILRRNRYDKLVVLTTLPAVLLGGYLLRNYRNRYLLDIRDFTYENVGFYKKRVHRLVEAARMTSISSRGFLRWLQEGDKLYVTHNITNEAEAYPPPQPRFGKGPYTIGYVGGVRYYEANIKLVRQLANHSRYALQYIGKTYPQCDLRPYCREHHIDNVTFCPAFRNEEKPQLYSKIDLIHSLYGAGNQEVATLLPNRLYDCVLFQRPILVSKRTYLAEIVEQYHLGLALDLDQDDVPAALDAYISGFDEAAFTQGCADFLLQVAKDEKIVNAHILDFLVDE